MIQKIYRILFLLFVIAGSIRLSAQTPSSDVGVWIVDSELAETNDVEDGDDINIDFEEEVGYGISFNHFWTDQFSTEVAVQKFGGDMKIGVDSGAGTLTFTAGELDAMSVTAMAQLHFRRATRFAPYLAAGVARVWGDFDPIDDPDDPEESAAVDLEAKTTWAAAAGANVRITDHVYFAGEMKYIPWEAIAENDPDNERVDVNPVTFAAGVKVRF
ncbi:MAG: OmpW family outer membrane protein [Thermoanaerobaculia bacterium]